jgi:hypothetical protein
MDESPSQVVLEIRNTRPIAAADLGRVFSSIAADYRAAAGRELVVARVEKGSIVAFLQDVGPYIQHTAEVASTFNDLFDFAKNIAELALLAIGGLAVKKIFGSGGMIGSRTVESLAKIAISAGATVEISQLGSKTAILKITPAEGTRIRNFAKKNKKLKKKRDGQERALEFRVQVHDALVDIAQEDEPTLKRLIAAFAKILEARSMSALLLDVGRDLELSGHHRAAVLLREAHDRRNSKR